MKREILFRGKRVFDNKFEHGFLSWHSFGDGVNYFVNNNVVYPETVGQFTGMTDKNGHKVRFSDELWIPFDDVLDYVVTRMSFGFEIVAEA